MASEMLSNPIANIVSAHARRTKISAINLIEMGILELKPDSLDYDLKLAINREKTKRAKLYSEFELSTHEEVIRK